MKTLVIIALLPLARFGFPHREGQELEVEKKQGEEIIEAGYAKLVVDPEAAAVKAEEEAKAAAAVKAEEEAKAAAAVKSEEEAKAAAAAVKAEEEAKAAAAVKSEEEAKAAAAAKTK